MVDFAAAVGGAIMLTTTAMARAVVIGARRQGKTDSCNDECREEVEVEVEVEVADQLGHDVLVCFHAL